MACRLPAYQVQVAHIMSTLIRPEGTGSITRVWRLRAAIEPERLAAAVRLFCDRHDALRTTIERAGDPLALLEDPTLAVQVVHDEGQSDVAVSPVPPGADEAALFRTLSDECSSRIDLERGPTFVARIAPVGVDDVVLVVSTSHTIADEQSLQVFERELGTLYEALGPGGTALPAPPASSVDVLVALEERLDTPEVLSYWRTTLRGARPVPFPIDAPWTAEPTYLLHPTSMAHGPELTERFAEACTTSGMPPQVLFMAAVNQWVRDVSGADDVCLTLPVSFRQSAETRLVVGMMTSLLFVRTRVSESPLATTRATWRALMGALRHQDTRFMPFFGDPTTAFRVFGGEANDAADFEGMPSFVMPQADGVRVLVESALPNGWPAAERMMDSWPVWEPMRRITAPARHDIDEDNDDPDGLVHQIADIELGILVGSDGCLETHVRYSKDLFHAEPMAARLARFPATLAAVVGDVLLARHQGGSADRARRAAAPTRAATG